MQPVELNTKLIKLHLKWPDRKQFGGAPGEAIVFFKWLFLNHHDKPEVMALDNVEDVEDFLKRNRHVLRPIKKPVKDEDRFANLRREPRIENDVRVLLSVNSCETDVSLVGLSSTGRSLDLGLHGMRLAVDKDLPAHSELKLIVEANDEIHYQLLGDARWIAPREGEYLMGIKIVEADEFARWQQEFGMRFVAPKIARAVRHKASR